MRIASRRGIVDLLRKLARRTSAVASQSGHDNAAQAIGGTMAKCRVDFVEFRLLSMDLLP
jgi:hypothetical protein